ncbi:MAG: NAD(P)/FAD-dependent oxidoreductase [Gammaproteobacteria bacterium]|jgi:spermidine dehydrogenase|nr:NAD(P)/FAD-dependent oxidoreductase [Gammaproteobacteria bacterium]MBT5601968.1 NAD(P)/FAD-dependent oxidoreductase [Gammaproteobacteria bacterium]MBT6243886.1 NAD(P)/FAD-dependent oxidoreductase [Gammaproteobacteria bacterium]
MKKLPISRRDFMNGLALSLAGGTTLAPIELMAKGNQGVGPYPPALTGLRGNHAGSFEVAHALSWAGASWPRPSRQTDDVYDLVIVGGGLSGLAAASMYQQQAGSPARVLILDNHDDFGGHAKRNEFTVNGKLLIGYGGSQSLEAPGDYSEPASQMLKAVGVDTEAFYDYFDRSYFRDRKLQRGIYFSKAGYGADSIHKNILRGSDDVDLAETIQGYPISKAAKRSLLDLLTSETDYLAGSSIKQKQAFLKSVSYSDFLRHPVGADEEVVVLLRDVIKGNWGLGFDALSAMEGYRLVMPGTWYLGLEGQYEGTFEQEEPYIFHFPDGNAGVARSIVRKLIPDAVPGTSMEDQVLARVNYAALDQPPNTTRIRLNSTAVDVRHAKGEQSVDVTYVKAGRSYRVKARHTILACYNKMVPEICPEVPPAQIEAIDKASKVPMVYISIALRNWKAFERLGYHRFYVPRPNLVHSFGMDFPVSMGGYDYTQKASEPTIVHANYVPTVPDKGLSQREQNEQGRRILYELTFDDFERDIVAVMSAALADGGFDAQRDIAGITVNRWPHGYAYEYNELYDPHHWTSENGPHQLAAARIGRISIANSDASAMAYVNGAFDAAYRAVNEQLGLS